MSQEKFFYLGKIPQEYIKKTLQLLEDSYPRDFTQKYEQACTALNIESKNQVINLGFYQTLWKTAAKSDEAWEKTKEIAEGFI